MGTEVFLNWLENGEEKWIHIFKLSFYPYELEDYEIPDGDYSEKLDSKYLQIYLEWLKKLSFLIKFAPEIYMKYNNTSNTIEEIKRCLEDDLLSLQGAINKVKTFESKKIKLYISVG